LAKIAQDLDEILNDGPAVVTSRPATQ